IVIGATNRPDVLDQALLRPGRFDRRVFVQPPDRTGREAILNVHTRGVPVAPSVDLGRIAATTPGMVGADLANLVNEAALLAARREHEHVEEADFTYALDRIVLGAERQVMMSEADSRRTAYHEAGHAEVSEQTQQLVDSEVRRIVDEAHERVVRLLTSERGKLDSLAGALLEHETLDEDAAYAAAGVAHEKADESQPDVVPAATAARISG